MLEEHLEWANASYYHSSEGTVNSNTCPLEGLEHVTLRALIQSGVNPLLHR